MTYYYITIFLNKIIIINLISMNFKPRNLISTGSIHNYIKHAVIMNIKIIFYNLVTT